MKESIKLVDNSFPEWYNNGDHVTHKINALEFMMLVLIRKNCKWTVDKQKKFPDKLKTLTS